MSFITVLQFIFIDMHNIYYFLFPYEIICHVCMYIYIYIEEEIIQLDFSAIWYLHIDYFLLIRNGNGFYSRPNDASQRPWTIERGHSS